MIQFQTPLWSYSTIIQVLATFHFNSELCCNGGRKPWYSVDDPMLLPPSLICTTWLKPGNANAANNKHKIPRWQITLRVKLLDNPSKRGTTASLARASNFKAKRYPTACARTRDSDITNWLCPFRGLPVLGYYSNRSFKANARASLPHAPCAVQWQLHRYRY